MYRRIASVLATFVVLSLTTDVLAEPPASKPAGAKRPQTALTWHGHAAFKIVTPAGKILLVDPWLTNPANKTGADDLAKLDKADLVLVTHGHGDHVGDAVAIGKKTGAKLVATFDLGHALVQAGFPKAQFGYETTGNFGGEIELLGGNVKVAFIPAVHSSAVSQGEGAVHEGGNPGGFLITIRGGPTLYHTGDTDFFSDMALVRQFRKVDVLLACIGDRFTMGPDRAAEATKAVAPATVIPMHFGTFPVLTGTPEAFDKALKKVNAKAKLSVMKVGETAQL